MIFKIAKIGNSRTIRLAANELKKYLNLIDGENDCIIMSLDSYNPEIKEALWVGQSDAFPLPRVKDSELDDAVSISVSSNCGYISGTNERSVLIAVYRYLRELGCAFLRPGSGGEVIPERSLKGTAVKVFEAASYRHRAVCIEGALSYDHVRDFLEWLPKNALNGFYVQFKTPHHYFDQWYSHRKNEKNYTPYHLETPDIKGILNEVVDIITERSLIYHNVGHGWTCEPFGIDILGWGEENKPPSDEVRRHLALIGGKRDFWNGVAINTNLCYSSAEVRDILADDVVKYAKAHPEVNYLHVWLADDSNNHCECENCLPHRPSDLYVKLLNHIDKKLTEAGLNTKIVFLLYVDLLWEPLEERFENPDRFVLMFAPITRSYSSSMADSTGFSGELKDYARNKNDMPSSVAENLAHLKNWQKHFEGDSFDFDYHLMWDHYKDLGNYQISEVLFKDMANLDKAGLNGMVSCQTLRSFFPHGLGMNCMAAALWDKTADFEATAEKYFLAAFGKDGLKVKDYIKKLSAYADPKFMRAEHEHTVDPARAEGFKKGIELADAFRPVIEKNLDAQNKAVALSYRYLLLHNDYAKIYLDFETALTCGEFEKADKLFIELTEYITENEKELHRVFDIYTFLFIFNNSVIKKIKEKH